MIAFRGGELLKSGFRSGLGSGFRGLVDYLQEGPKLAFSEPLEAAGDDAPAESFDLPDDGGRIAWSTTRNLPVDDPASAPRWMRAWANQNPRVKKPVYHFGVSIAPDEDLGPEQWEMVADRLLERLGLEEHQAVIALHEHREHGPAGADR